MKVGSDSEKNGKKMNCCWPSNYYNFILFLIQDIFITLRYALLGKLNILPLINNIKSYVTIKFYVPP